MAEVLEMERFGGDAAAEVAQPKYQRLRRQSRLLAVAISALGVLYVAFNAALVVATPLINGDLVHMGPGAHASFGLGAGQPGSVTLSSFSISQRLAFALLLALRAVPVGAMLSNLRALFRLYAAGTVFAQENAVRIKRMGLWLILFSATPYVIHEISVPLGNNFDGEWFHMEEVYALVAGVILYVVAQVMEVGHEIEQERDEFV